MTILSKKPVTLAEVKEIVSDMEKKEELNSYLKNFTKLSSEKSEEMRKSLADLKSHKIKEENIVKLIDFAPRDAEEFHKIFAEVSFSEEEINAVLKIVKGN